jgi:adenosylcobinamide-phosphate synthase
MTFFAILLALLVEQARPLGFDNPVHAALRAWARWTRRSLDTGQPRQGAVAWMVAVLVPTALTAAVHWLLWQFSVLLAFMWMAVVLYHTVGFRQFSHHFTEIRDALEAGDEMAARQALALWRRVDVSQIAREELLRHAIEHSVLAAHRHVFGVLVWFLVLALLGLGPAGAVLYRLTEYLSRSWQARPDGTPSVHLQRAAAIAWQWVDHVPVRVTALAFAVVGNFEDAVASWRQDAARFPNPNDGVVLAATAGAINVRLGGRALGDPVALPGPGVSAGTPQEETAAPSTDGREPQLAHLGSVVGLVWRSVVMWMLLLALLTLARLP